MENEIVEYNITNAAIAKMEDLYMALTVADLDDKEGFDAVHSGRMVIRSKRVEVEKKRKEYKADSLAWGRKVDTEAKRIFGLLEPIETHLQFEEDKITKEKERIKAEEEAKEKVKIENRVGELFALDVNVPFFDMAMLSDDEYSEMLHSAKMAYEAEQLRLAEKCKRKEAEEKRLADERAELDRIRQEQERKAKVQEEREQALQAERDKIEAEKRAEQERKDREIFEKQAAENARIQAEKDAKDKIERETEEKKKQEEAYLAEEARQEMLRPDKDKLIIWAKAIKTFPIPAVSNEKAQEIVANGLGKLMKIGADITIQAKEL